MTSGGDGPTRSQLEAAIAAQEGLREVLGDATVDATITVLRDQVSKLADVVRRRRLMTILFVDIVESTRLVRDRDPEEAMALLDSALTALAEPIAAHGGRVTRFMGDGFMAVFGLVTSRENDPEMAVGAGLAVVEEASRLAEAEAIERFAVRVGINTGLVVSGGATEAEDTVMGDAVNLAARLEAAAPPGGVLISDATRRHVRNRFAIESAGEITAKGFADPVAVFTVVGPSDAPTARPDHDVEGLEIPMVGRAKELAELRAVADATTATGTLRSVTVIGEAGLGKSRLVEEFRSGLSHDRFTILDAAARLETATLPYFVVRNLLERRYGTPEGREVHATVLDGIRADFADDPRAAIKAKLIGQMIGYELPERPDAAVSLNDPQQIRDRAVVYLAELLERIAGRQPILVHIEDLHWADGDSLDVIEELVDVASSLPILVVATTRPSIEERRPGWGNHDGDSWIRIGHLTESASSELTSSLLRRITDCPPELHRSLVTRSEGNPYYLEEIVRMLVDDGVLSPGPDAWTVDPQRIADLRIPSTLTGVIQARLDGLPPDERGVLQRASVIGRVFWDGAITHLGLDRLDRDIGACLASLTDRGMIQPAAESAFPGATEYRFHHEVLRSVAYEGVLLDDRRAHHSDIADWLIDQRGKRAGDLAGMIASHLERAGRTTEAVDFYSAAADEAAAAYAVGGAAEFFERALALAPEGDARRYGLLLGFEGILGMQGRTPEHRSVLDELSGLAGGDTGREAEVSVRAAWFHYFQGEMDDSMRRADVAVATAVAAADPVLESKARVVRVWSEWDHIDRTIARRQAEQALDKAGEGGDADALTNARNALGLLAVDQREFSVARLHLRVNLEHARATGDLKLEAKTLNNLAVVEIPLGNFTTAAADLDRFLEIALEMGDRWSEATAAVNLAWLEATRRNWQAACTSARAGLDAKRSFGHADAEAEGLMWLAHAELGLGHLDEALSCYDEALTLRSAIGQPGLAMGAHAGLALTLLKLGRPDEAKRHAVEILGHLDEGRSLTGAWEPLHILLRCYRVLAAVRHPGSKKVLEWARRMLASDLAGMEDEADRRSYSDVYWRRELLELTSG